MSIYSDYISQAELAFAAYADLTGPVSGYKVALEAAGMASSQADLFLSTNTVLIQYNAGNGLSVTVFADAFGKKYLSIRGTEPSALDLAANGLLALGLPASLNPQFTALKAQIELWRADPTKLGSDPFTVTGHSLGGYLAAAVKAQYGSQVTDAYLYNAPGVAGPAGNLFALFGLSGAPTANVWNITASEGASIISGLGAPVGTPVSVQIEAAPGAGFGNHRIFRLTDALAVQALHATLDGNLTRDQLNALVDASGSTMNNTLEGVLDAMRKLLLGPAVVATETDNRDAFYANLYALQRNPAYINLAASGSAQISVLSTRPADQISALASTNNGQGLAIRYALQVLNPFALVGINYSSLNTDGALDLYNVDSAPNGMTPEYLADRSSFLERKLWFSTQDKNPVKLAIPEAPEHPRFEGDSTFFKDYASGYQIAQGFAPDSPFNNVHRYLFGDGIANTLPGGGVGDSLYGGAGNDVLIGLGGDDYLEGNADADTLDGGAGDDTLLGGSGADVFIVGLNAGQDTILNPDSTDQLHLAGRTLNGAGTFKRSASGVTVWVDSSQVGTPVTYIHDAVNRELMLVGAGSSVRVRDFDSGELGISVPVAPAPTPAPTAAASFDLSTAAGRYQWSLRGTLPQTDNWRVFNANNLTTGSVLTAQGNDVIVGGTASITRQTFLSSGAGNDRVYSGTEQTLAEAIAAGEVQAATGRSVYMLAGDIGDDWLVGAGDDDALFGGKGNDTLIGGSGSDVIFADGNNDYAFSVDGGTGTGSWIAGVNDAATDQQRQLRLATAVAAIGTTPLGQQVFKTLTGYINPLAETDLSGLLTMQRQNVVPDAGDTRTYAAGSQRTYADLTGGAWFGTNVGHGNDVIHAGAGDDVVNAGGGDDVIDAATGNDQVAGYDGNDVIYGGAGNDRLQGDYQVAVTTGDAVENLSYYGASGVIRYTLDASRHGQDVIDGGAGNDVIFGGGASDLLYGGADNDVIYGDDYKLASQYVGDDYLDGGDGNDQLVGGGGADELIGGDGADRLEGDDLVADVPATWHGADRLDGGSGDDDLYGGGGDDVLLGGEGNDWLAGEDQLTVNSVSTLTGNDSLDGGAGKDTLIGGAGNDTLIGGGGADQLYGGAGNDVLIASGIGGVLDSGAGRDLLQIAEGSNITINVTSASAADADDLMLGGGLASTSVTVAVSGSLDPNAQTATLTFAGSATTLRLSTSSATSSLGNALNTLQFSDGVTWSAADIRNKLHGSVSDGADTLVALNGIDDALASGGGNDLLSGANGNDYLDGGDGNDFLIGRVGNDTLIGGEGDDALEGDAGNDVYVGGAGRDEMYDSSTGSADVYRYGRGGGRDAIDDFGGVDRLELDAGITENDIQIRRFYGQYGSIDDYLVLSTSDGDFVRFGSWISSDASDTQKMVETIRFAGGNEWDVARIKQESLKSTAGADRFIGYVTGDTIDGGEGDDFIDGGLGNDFLIGGNGHDDLRGSLGGDTLYGGAGNDTLDGQEDFDTLIGGAGNDLLYGSNGTDVFRFDVGDGADILRLYGTHRVEFGAGIIASALSVRNVAGSLVISTSQADSITVENLFSLYTGQIKGTLVQIKFADQSTWTASEIEAEALRQALLVTSGADLRYLSAGGDSLGGGDGNDTLYGLGGNDTLLGEGGNDWLYGDIGNDWLLGGAGDDMLYASDEFGVEPGNDLLDGGVGNDILYGAQSNDSLLGGDGDDMLHGGIGGFDIFDGGAGNDALVDVNGDVVRFGRGDGQDVVQTYTFAASGINSTIEFKTGVLPSDIVARRVPDGQFAGVAGLELSILGTTDKILLKSYFNPGTYSVIQQVRFSDGTVWDTALIQQKVTEDLAQRSFGTDASDSLTGGGADDELYGLGGSDLLTGNAGNDTLDGGADADTLVGGIGDDIYRVDSASDVLIEIDNAGWDTVESSITFVLPEHVDVLRLQGSGNINATGNASTNLLVGNAGANRLDGGGGFDSLMGGAGNDTYVVDHPSDYIYEYADGGLDSVKSSIHWVLGEEVENLTLTGTVALSGTGNPLNNVLNGNSANNLLTGGAGDDTLDGGAGNDTLAGGKGDDVYIVDSSADVATEAAGEGADTVRSSVTLTLRANLENLTLTGTDAINATGNSLNNVVMGNSANNTLNGGAGADTLTGGAGNDVYVVDATTDVVIEAANEGTDTVQSAVTWTLSDTIENLTLTGSTAINGTGNTLNNSITGNTANNTLTGGVGNDTLNGGAGTDTLIGGTGTDTLIGGIGNDIYVVDAATDVVTEATNEGTDTVQSTVTWALGDTVEHLTLTGSAAINGTGNAGNN